jgi:hypothetical protein
VDSTLNTVILSGTPMAKKDSLGNDMSGYYLGGTARWRFICPGCSREYETVREYRTTDSALVEGAVLGGLANLRRSIQSAIHLLPIIGRFLNDRVQRRIAARMDALHGQRRYSLQSAAFDEIRHRFSICGKCGAYSCSACFSNGLCGACAGRGESAGGAAAEIDSQVQQIEETYRALIAANPTQRETFEQQKREIIERLRSAGRQVADGFEGQSKNA